MRSGFLIMGWARPHNQERMDNKKRILVAEGAVLVDLTDLE